MSFLIPIGVVFYGEASCAVMLTLNAYWTFGPVHALPE